jgi:hypothetical protein
VTDATAQSRIHDGQPVQLPRHRFVKATSVTWKGIPGGLNPTSFG